ncbi:50S ribosomal protein L22 [Candidatus Woesearchaeota archaeon]|nr:50S ribosomal protein L22 [Candidatus Woesearchaeota archaeon]
MAGKYSIKEYGENMARAAGRALPVSTKASVEICSNLRKKTVARSKNILKGVIALAKPIKFTRFTNGAGHKKSIGAGKYPQKAAREMLKLLEAAEANAQFRGINTSGLVIKHISAYSAGNVWRYGRHRRRKMKRTNIEIVVEEGKTGKRKGRKGKKALPEATDKKINDKQEIAAEKKPKAEKESKEKEEEKDEKSGKDAQMPVKETEKKAGDKK